MKNPPREIGQDRLATPAWPALLPSVPRTHCNRMPVGLSCLVAMLDIDRVERPLRRLRKMLRTFPPDPLPEQVHALRTETRRFEAVVQVLMLESNHHAQRLLKLLNPFRKAAGHVRDMDVLIGDVLTLGAVNKEMSVVQLVEHLSRVRIKYAGKLGKTVNRHGKEARKHVKACLRIVNARIREEADGGIDGAGPQILATELRHWPRLDETNLHEFRIRLKELNYVLQFSPDADSQSIRHLTEVKNSIGEWHDWLELLNMAKKILDSQADRELLQRIESIEREKLQQALSLAGFFQKRYLDASHHPGKSRLALSKAAGI